MLDAIKKEARHLATFLEKWTELDVIYYVKNASVLFSTQAVLILSAFALSVGFAHLASKELFGQFQFILAILGMLSVLTLPGANNAVLLGVSQNKDGTWWQGVRLKLKWSIVGILGLITTAAYFYTKHDPHYAGLPSVFLISIIFFPLLYSVDVNHSFFAGKKKFEWSCAFQLISEAGSALAALAALYFTKSLVIIMIAYLIMQAIGDIGATWLVLKKLENDKEAHDFTSYSVHLTVINFIPYIKSYFDKIIVTYFLGFASTALYTIAAAMSEQVYAVSKSIGLMTFPKFAIHGKEKTYEIVRKHTFKLAIVFVFFAAAGALIAPYVIPFFFSAQYSTAVPIAQLLLLIVIPRAIATVLTRVQEAQKQKKKLYSINAIYASVEMVALAILIPLYGLYGIVAAKAFSNVIYLGLSWRALR